VSRCAGVCAVSVVRLCEPDVAGREPDASQALPTWFSFETRHLSTYTRNTPQVTCLLDSVTYRLCVLTKLRYSASLAAAQVAGVGCQLLSSSDARGPSPALRQL
jgi:hypothetical protein